MFDNIISRQLWDTVSLTSIGVVGDPHAAHSDSILLLLHFAFRTAF